MALGTLDRSLPPFFNQGPSVLSKLVFFGALSVFLMVADVRFRLIQPVRSVLVSVLQPVQWLALQPVDALRYSSEYFSGLNQAQLNSAQADEKLAEQSVLLGQVEQLSQENARLRQLLGLRERLAILVDSAEVLYDMADPYTRKILISKGQAEGIVKGSPVLDEFGVLGQVTRVHLQLSEVTLLTDSELSIPVLNVRTGARSVAYGDPSAGSGGMELRFMGSNADVQPGDLLTTSGVDGLYPAGLPVAKIRHIERRSQSAFLKIDCQPLALVTGTQHVIVVRPLTGQIPPRPEVEAPPVRGKKESAP